MRKSSTSDQLSLFSGPATDASGKDMVVIRPWRSTLADTWDDVHGLELDTLEQSHRDLLRRNREFLKALDSGGLEEETADIAAFREAEVAILGNYVFLKRGMVQSEEIAEVARIALDASARLATLREVILKNLDSEVSDGVLRAEARVRVDDRELDQAFCQAELAISQEMGDVLTIEIPLPPKSNPHGFLGPGDVDALVVEHLRNMKDAQERRPLPRQARLETLLRGLPVEWLDAICNALDIESGTLRRRKQREQAVADLLTRTSTLHHIVRDKLKEQERALLRFLLAKDGQCPLATVVRRFGRDAEDGWL